MLTFTTPRSLGRFIAIQNAIELALTRHDARPCPEDKIDETQSSHVFRDRVAAYQYYRKQGCDWDEINRKIADKEIELGWIESFQSWDKDQRAVIYTPEAMRQRALSQFMAKQRRSIFDVKWAVADIVRDMETALTVVRKAGKAKEIKTKKALEATVKEFILTRWKLELPYCGFGKPWYDGDAIAKEEKKADNRRSLKFTFKGKTFTLVTLRKCGNSSISHHWGMADRAPVTILLDDQGRMVSTGTLHPNKKAILAAIIG